MRNGVFRTFHQRGGPRPWPYRAAAALFALLVVAPPSAPLEVLTSPQRANERASTVLVEWSEAVPASAPVLELGGSIETGGRGNSDGRGGPAGMGARDDTGPQTGTGAGSLHLRPAGLRTPLPRSVPARPAGAFLPHRATAPPFRA